MQDNEPFCAAARLGDEQALRTAWDALLTEVYSYDGSDDEEPEGYEGSPAAVLNELGAHKSEDGDSDVCVEKTPLMLAAMGGHARVLSLLLSMGADATVQDSDGKTAMEHASSDAVRALLRAARPVTEQLALNAQLLDAASAGNTLAVEAVLAHGGVFTEPMAARHRKRGFFPLHYAARTGDLCMTNALLAAGAYIEQMTLWEGATPLILAAIENDADVVEALLDGGAATEVENVPFTPEFVRIRDVYFSETTALGHAVEHGSTHVVMLLLERGANSESLLESVMDARQAQADASPEPRPQGRPGRVCVPPIFAVARLQC
jgi:ankyrin repeat protein